MDDELVYREEADYLIGTRYYLHQAGGRLVGGAARRLREGFAADRGAEGAAALDGASWEAAAAAVGRCAEAMDGVAERLADLLAKTPERKMAMGVLRANRTKVELEAQSGAFGCWRAARALRAELEDAAGEALAPAMPRTLDALDAFADEAANLAPASEYGDYSSSRRAERLASWDWRGCSSFTELTRGMAIGSDGFTVGAYARACFRDAVAPAMARALDPEGPARDPDALVEDALELAVEEGARAMAADLSERARFRFADNSALAELTGTVIPRVARATCARGSYLKHVRERAEAMARGEM